MLSLICVFAMVSRVCCGDLLLFVLHLRLGLSEPALSSLVALYGLLEVVLGEVGPIGVAEVEFLEYIIPLLVYI